MKLNLQGCTRIVIILCKIVIKIPNFTYAWRHFLSGLLANISERDTWRWNSGQYEKGYSYLLCPVKWCSYGGWILIMQKVDKVLNWDDDNKYDYSLHIEHFPGDDKVENYGLLNGNLVKIDYGQY